MMYNRKNILWRGEELMKLTGYRYPSERVILGVTFLLILVVLILAAGVTICIAPLFIVVLIWMSSQATQAHHRDLMRHAFRVTPEKSPSLDRLLEDCTSALRPGKIECYVVQSRDLNAYTFGLSSPEVVVVYSSLFDVMDADELRFILGHELGHVALGHAWLNTVLGGMAGVPTSLGAAVILTLAFRSWNRACEFSADRAGLLACGKINKAITALVKLVNKEADTPAEIKETLALIEREDDDLGNVLLSSLSTHPMLVRRINELKAYAASTEYQRLQQQANTQRAQRA